MPFRERHVKPTFSLVLTAPAFVTVSVGLCPERRSPDQLWILVAGLEHCFASWEGWLLRRHSLASSERQTSWQLVANCREVRRMSRSLRVATTRRSRHTRPFVP